ncbi:MAG: DUF86 domain-containing protein [Methanomassiliicoccaceae archaeon]|jgi:uncharacterized protein with HEPN domain|nr:DUF86 domain-containing protein [Methanomassiliicoccaceae archaeon]
MSFCLSQIGETVKDLSEEFIMKYPEITWKEVAGMRGVINHGYHKIEIGDVWITVTEDVPVLKAVCEKILDVI